VLSFGVSSVPFVFSTILSCLSTLMRFYQVSIKRSLKIMMFSKDFLKASLFCDFLRCMYYFARLGKV
jgi:hypothetical protein